MHFEFWKCRSGISFTRDETITVKNGDGRVIERITCTRVSEVKTDEKGDYRLCKMEVQYV